MTAPLPLHLLLLEDALEVRRQRGIDAYREGDASRPFVGDAAAEAFEEALDLLVYAEEMDAQGESRAEVEHVATLALGDLLRPLEPASDPESAAAGGARG